MVARSAPKRLIDEGSPFMKGRPIVASPECRRIAYIGRSHWKEFVIADGQEQKRSAGS